MFSGYLGFVTFDPTGSIETFPSEINSDGEVVGYYETPKPGGMYSHGFVYTAGTITTFNVPGATDTIALGINATGQITGYCDTHGFIDIAGTITTFDVPGRSRPRQQHQRRRRHHRSLRGSRRATARIHRRAMLLRRHAYRDSRGELLVEALREGDRVLSAFGGAVPVVWIGHRDVDCRRHPAPRDVGRYACAPGRSPARLRHAT